MSRFGLATCTIPLANIWHVVEAVSGGKPSYLAEYNCPQSVDELLLQHQLIGFGQHPHLNVWPILKNGQPLKIPGQFNSQYGRNHS